jgi:S1-C subfamily serine protease
MNIRSTWMRPKTAALAVALALGLGGLGLAAANHALSDNPPAALKFADANAGPSRTGFAPIVKKVLPAVVNISSSKRARRNYFTFEGRIV